MRTAGATRRSVLLGRYIPVAAGALLLSVALAAGRPLEEEKPAATVRVRIDYGNGVEKHYNAIGWRAGMTVLDALGAARDARPGIEFRHRGRGETAFVYEIDGFANGPAGRESMNWLFSVNDELMKRSCGVVELSAGDVVRWSYEKWKN